jgi:hypothetical protein
MGRAIDPFAFAQGKARPGDIKDEFRDLIAAVRA